MSTMKIFIFLCLFGGCLGGESCDRASQLVGDILDWIRHDGNLYSASSGMVYYQLDYMKDEVLDRTGIDFLSSTDRQQFICRAFRVKGLKQVYDFLVDETSVFESANRNVTYGSFCHYYQLFLQYYGPDANPILDVDMIKTVYTLGKELSEFSDKSNFPYSFPPRVDASELIDDLGKILTMIETSMESDDFGDIGNYGGADFQRLMMYRGILTDLLPILPPLPWESRNSSSIEEIVNWMKDSDNIYDYASHMITYSGNRYMGVNEFKDAYYLFQFFSQSYEKYLWYEELVKLLTQKTKLFRLDTSDCPAMPDANNMPHY